MRENCSEKYKLITETLISRGISITTMESCTSGLIASLITDTEGASAVLRGAFITYSNEAKIRCGVPAEIIDRYGVYSEETARAMAQAAANAYNADISVGITGSFANADPENADSEPGVVYFAIYFRGMLRSYTIEGVHGSYRHEDKLIAADYVADELLGILQVQSI